ncbi:MAG: ParA family protein [Lachnospiraceae bacterium]|jgi:chromosome partitioning protein|nr:ParA family protein [Lachnospiraceae bacterium]
MKEGAIYSVASMKGGVAKTTTTLNLAYAFAQMGKKVLAVDLDPQGNLTICAGVADYDNLEHTAYTLLLEALEDNEDEEPKKPSAEKAIVSCGIFDLIPCNNNLAAFETNKGHVIGVESSLKVVVEPLRGIYDVIIIDTQPSFGILPLNAIVASESVIIPITPQLLSAVGARDLFRMIKRIKKHYNPNIAIEGIVMCLCDTRTKIYREVNKLVEDNYGQRARIFDAVIPVSVKVSEANMASKSVIEYAPDSKPAEAYINLAKEIAANTKR